MNRQELLVLILELVAIVAAIAFMAGDVAPRIVLPILGLVLVCAGFALMWLSRHRRDVEGKRSVFNHPFMNAVVYPAMIIYSFWTLWHRL